MQNGNAKPQADYFDNLEGDFEAENKPVKPVSNRRQFTDALTARQYIHGGKGTVTLKSKATKNHFTYELGMPDDGSVIFVKVLVGPDNTASYKYLGLIKRDVFWAGRKNPRPGDIARDAPSAKAFAWVWQHLVRDHLPVDQVEVWHEGQCGRCGRKLTHPDSIERGIGPECIKKV